jgi:hypothetical protein
MIKKLKTSKGKFEALLLLASITPVKKSKKDVRIQPSNVKKKKTPEIKSRTSYLGG